MAQPITRTHGHVAASLRFMANDGSVRATLGEMELGFDLDDVIAYAAALSVLKDMTPDQRANVAGAMAAFGVVCVEQDRLVNRA